MSEDVNFDYPMKKSCTNEITTLCKDVPPGTEVEKWRSGEAGRGFG